MRDLSKHLIPPVENVQMDTIKLFCRFNMFFLRLRAQDYFIADPHVVCLKLSWTPGIYVDVRVAFTDSDGTQQETLVRCGYLEHEGTEQERFLPYDDANEVYFYDDGPDSVTQGAPERAPEGAPERAPE